MGDILQANVLAFKATNDLFDELNSKAAGIVNYRAPSFGTFSTHLSPRYFYGVPRNVDFSGMVMDIDRSQYQLVDKNADYQNKLNYLDGRRIRGSMLEHLIPEQLLSTPENPVHGISAVKAIQLAAQEGQKIWHITQANLDTALQSINLQPYIEDEIRQNVNIGRVVTTHEYDVIYQGRVSTGYLIVDPVTGSGQALIDSGEDGASISFEDIDQESILDYISLFSEEVIDKFAGVKVKIFLEAKAVFDKIESSFKLLTSCDPLTGAIAVASIGEVGAALARIGKLFLRINIYLGIAFSIFSTIIMTSLAIGWATSINCRRNEGE